MVSDKEMGFRPEWPEGVQQLVIYGRRDDMGHGALQVLIDCDGDANIALCTKEGFSTVEFCTRFGGGRSPRTRDAILKLADAIRLDNEENPE